MCVDPTESYGLVLVTYALYEKVIRKSPIICVIVFDGYPVLARICLECGLSFYRLLGILSWRCTNFNLDLWSMNIVALLYLCLVSLPFI